ncbi:DUF4157 domain-containing protein [Luteibacter sp. dw_328]|uniref:eCIS core domain-containing protein n=1 Tax=Luteibacter sp. dw_328 TaxID=2719796 RepID=UPI001BD2CB61|nr:DUF4157 domain-containing protein [Luteibacter sp. dw_328]
MIQSYDPMRSHARRRLAEAAPAQRKVSPAIAAPDTGMHYARAGGHALPSGLRTGIESLSGLDMGGVRVHYGSPLPARLNALAYAQGSDIHLARGQEQHLPHEAWHVVQQVQGRVRANTRVEGVGVNDDASLEREADRMGSQAMQMRRADAGTSQPTPSRSGPAVAQLTVKKQKAGRWYSDYDPYTTFTTKAAATVHDKALRNQGVTKRRHFRVPTLYTHTHTKPHNRLTRALQGPHVVAHRLTLQALQSAGTLGDIQSIFDDQVLRPRHVDELIDDEAPPSGYNTQLSPRITRYLATYRRIYKRLKGQITGNSTDLIRAKHRLNKLLNLDPYATYGWKSLTKASKKSLASKGENVVNPTFNQLVDTPSSASIRNADAQDSFLQAREQLFDDHFP